MSNKDFINKYFKQHVTWRLNENGTYSGYVVLKLKRRALKDMSKYNNDMRDFYVNLLAKRDREIEHWKSRWIEAVNENRNANIYEKLLNKLLDGHPEKTDELIMFEGKFYKPTNFVLDMEPSTRSDVLTIECVRVDIFNNRVAK